jgi:chitin disaccharide deacetylase
VHCGTLGATRKLFRFCGIFPVRHSDHFPGNKFIEDTIDPKIILHVHCDDVGMTPAMTRRILSAWESGYINSFSILTNGSAKSEDYQLLFDHADKRARIAVHLNLTDGKPLSGHSNTRHICDSDGYFKHGFLGLFITLLVCSRKRRDKIIREIESEFESQIRAARSICAQRPITSLDGHRHVHMIPYLVPVLVRLAKKYCIPEVRLSREIFHISSILHLFLVSYLSNIIKFCVLRFFSVMARKHLKRGGISFPDSLVGILYSGMMTASNARSGLSAALRKSARSIELLFHIGRATGGELGDMNVHTADRIFSLDSRRDVEYAELIAFMKGYHARY